MARIITTKSITSVIIVCLLLVVLLWLRTESLQTKTIIIITKDQENTASLNPSRLIVAAELALADYQKQKQRYPITHQYITYTGEEQEGYDKARQYLKENKSVVAIVGDFNSAGTKLLAELAMEFEIPHISFFSTDETIFHEKSWSFSIRNRTAHEMDTMVQLINKHLQVEQVTILSSETSNLIQRAEELELALSSIGIKAQEILTVESGQIDFSNEITRIKGQLTGKAVVIFLGSQQLEHFLQQCQMAEITLPIISTGVVLHPDILHEFVGIKGNVYSVVPKIYLDYAERIDLVTLMERYKIAIGNHRLDASGLWIYDGFQVMYETMNASKNSSQLRNLLRDYNKRHVSYMISFDEHGLIKDSGFIPVTIQGSRFIEVEIP
ncbi:hypothetical protein BHU72_04735 [Desulfuribacillus stibiiarsenatis]|uniref:Receptor ligand binding region domain-containing protein n=1 Tax=Desulfuribacillus stibiiarsenatis TaxID=1390249 RepID=A0A1E5L5Z3_9FIRM|nr:ABC transporter substrate-binding protein [Desulfuribacillus stibiiarsenatis]OEH85399.1 hypothetical protein BHU72_04735 [Desulfuribacillus stibiiarsenatis]